MSHDEPRARLLTLESLRQDVTYALRGFRREPAMALIAILILALGIGANTAVFSIVNPLVLEPLPFPGADRLVWIANTGTAGLSGADVPRRSVRGVPAQPRRSRRWARYFAFFGFRSYTLTGRGDAQRLSAVDVSVRDSSRCWACSRSLDGCSPTPSSTSAAAPKAGPRCSATHAVGSSDSAATPRFSDQALTINGAPVTVVGIMPRVFDFSSVFTPGTKVDMFLPADLDLMRPWGNTLSIVGRLRARV